MNDIFNFHKFLWTEADFEQMNWHDATIYAFAFLPKRFEFLLDIDYILKWIEPLPNESWYRFLVAPATLVFENVWNSKIELEPDDQIQIINIERREPRKPKNSEYINREIEWKWIIETTKGEITFHSAGFKQHFKGMPVFGREQALDLDLRGGFSFSRVSE